MIRAFFYFMNGPAGMKKARHARRTWIRLDLRASFDNPMQQQDLISITGD